MIGATVSFIMHSVVTSARLLGPVHSVFNTVVTSYRSMASKTSKINFNTKHLGKGDPLPPFTGKLRVYNMRYCPYAQRTVLVLLAKKLDFEVVNVNLMDKPEWLTSKSPFGKVPSIEVEENECIYESLVTSEYIDEIYKQERPLISEDPKRRAFDKIIIESSAPMHTLMFKIIKMPDQISEENLAAYNNSLKYIEDSLRQRSTKFLHSDAEPGYVDYMIWPWFERLRTLAELDERARISENFPLLRKYVDNMLEDPVVADYIIPKNTLLEFTKGYKPGNKVNYELLTE